MYAGGSTGLAVLRRDGFASMDTNGAGTLTTKALTFSGNRLFVNADASKGTLAVEIVGLDGQAHPSFPRGRSLAVRGDKTCQEVKWQGKHDLSQLSKQPVKLRFHLTNASLYSFWISRSKSGASDGYVAAGGPGFTGPTDTVGTIL